MQVIKEFDFIGLVLFVGGLLIFLMGLSWGGSLYPVSNQSVALCTSTDQNTFSGSQLMLLEQSWLAF
jgi:hypothetical protein